MGIGELFIILFKNPIINLLFAFYKLLTELHVPYALGFSIILLTAAIKLILYPFVSAQIKSATKMQKIAPHLASVKERHKNDAKRQQEEMMKLYKEHGINPAVGCLPLLIQFPIIISLYQVLGDVINTHSVANLEKVNHVLYFPFLKISQLWDPNFFGLNLTQVPSKVVTHNVFILLIPFLTGFSQFILSKMMAPEPSSVPAVAKNKKSSQDDFQAAMQTQSLYIIPVIIAISSYSFPIGISLYWITFTIFGILQQYQLVGWGGAKPWIDKIFRKS